MQRWSDLTLIELWVGVAITASLAALLLSTSPKAGAIERPYYDLQRTKVADDVLKLRLYDKTTGRTVWTRKCVNAYAPQWSRDHRSFATVIGHIYGQSDVFNGATV